MRPSKTHGFMIDFNIKGFLEFKSVCLSVCLSVHGVCHPLLMQYFSRNFYYRLLFLILYCYNVVRTSRDPMVPFRVFRLSGSFVLRV
jgi:hypothetical protein